MALGIYRLYALLLLRKQFSKVLTAFAVKRINKTAATLDDRLRYVLQRPIAFGMIILGVNFAFTFLTFSESFSAMVSHILSTLTIALFAGILYRIVSRIKVRTFARALVSVPNGNIANTAILNWSEREKRQIKMTLGLTYSTTTAQMRSIRKEIKELLNNDDEIHQQTIYVHFTEFQESALGIFCYFFTKTTQWGEYMQVRERINLELMAIVEKNGASFAFPSQSLYIEKMAKNIVD